MIKAKYTKQQIPKYQGVKLIEALGEMPLTYQDTVRRLEFKNPITDKERTLPRSVRFTMVDDHPMFHVFSWHYELSRQIDLLIREPCLSMSPKETNALLNSELSGKEYQPPQSSKVCLLTAPSGSGKTTFIRRKLSEFPQAVQHPDGIQIPYVFITAPSNGSIRSFCQRILDYYSEVTGHSIKTRGKNGEEMTKLIRKQLALYQTSLVVVDEVQRMAQPQVISTFHDYFTDFLSGIQANMIWIGTDEAGRMLRDCEHLTRRVTSGGRIPVCRFGFNDEWKEYVADLWDHTVITSPKQELTDEMQEILYDLTLGSPSFVADLLKKAVETILKYDEFQKPVEKITKKFLVSVQARNYPERYALVKSEMIQKGCLQKNSPDKPAGKRNAGNVSIDKKAREVRDALEASGYGKYWSKEELFELAKAVIEENGIKEELPRLIQAAVGKMENLKKAD